MALYSKVYRDLQGLQSSSVSLSTLFVIWLLWQLLCSITRHDSNTCCQICVYIVWWTNKCTNSKQFIVLLLLQWSWMFFYVVRTVHFGVKLYNTKHNA
jgi:hypothetical protein